MDEFIRKVYERGKITIPKELRDLYGVHDGDLVKLRIVKVIQAMEEGRRVEREQEIEVTARFEEAPEPSDRGAGAVLGAGPGTGVADKRAGEARVADGGSV